MKHLIPALLIIFLFFGCGGGGGGGSDDDSSSEPTLMISSSEAVPGSFITVEDDSIKEGEELNVTFENTSGYEVTIKTILTEDGSAEVPVPPIVNLSTGYFTSSKVTVSIPSGGQATLNVLPLPSLTGVSPGDIVKMYLLYTKRNFDTALDNMDEFSLEFDYDTSALEQQIQTQIETIETSINEIETSAQMSMYSYYDGKIVLDQNDLGILDRLLFAVLKGAMNEDLKLAANENAIAASVNILAAGSSELTPAQLESWVNSNIKNSKVVLVGIGGMIVTVAGAVMGAEVAAGATILYTFQATGASILVVGTASEGLAAIRSFINKNNLDPDQVYVFGNEFQQEGWEGLKNMGMASGSEKSNVINLISFLYTEYGVTTALSNLICNSNPVPAGFEDYCKKWEASHQPKPLAIKLLNFNDEVMAPGVEGNLEFLLEGNGDAGPVSIEIDWGDGDGEVISLKVGTHYDGTGDDAFQTKMPSMYHTYTLGGEGYKYFKIKVSAEDSDGQTASAEKTILVTKNLEPSIAFSSIPSRIKTNTTKTWGITVTGGKAPYTYTISWGDGSQSLSGIFDTAGDQTLNHKYTSPGIYTVSIEVTDSNKLSASDTSEADVRDPVSIVSINGPTSLDVKERGTWTVTLDGGWEPYTGSTDWDDFNITPINSQSRLLTIFHAYTEKDPNTYSVLVTITDDEGDMDDKGFTVKVPKTAPTFAYTSTNICDEFDDPIIRHGRFTINDNNTITMYEIESDQSMTTALTGDSFIFQQTWGGLKLVFEGTIDIDESTGVITGNGTMNTYRSDGSISCSGTWTSN